MMLLLLAFFVGLSVADDAPRVKTPNGVVVGHYSTSYNGRKFAAFEGIPYAKKPIGALRFEVSKRFDVRICVCMGAFFRNLSL